MSEEHKKSSLLQDDDFSPKRQTGDILEETEVNEDEEKGRLSSFEVIPEKASQLADSQHFESRNASPDNIPRKSSIMDSIRSKSRVLLSGSTR